ncbi:MAG: hypothetical protein CBB67_022430 [Alteromonadaceae bacterium TMED7]|jgi:hypothetical protein|nr:MAG: hypothetical protein CBB67_022430 [Alteromonadaceae bacterium TMED7]|tara:strand:- start:422 stop:754 length:333 start_codon:yes stop_codon:yes gene_type:complete
MTSITFKDNISFMYIIMEALRQEIRDEMQTLRINKKHVYGLLMRLVDELDSTPAPAPAPAPAPVPAPVVEQVEEAKAPAPAPVEEAPKPVKKVVRRVKKKVDGASDAVLK